MQRVHFHYEDRQLSLSHKKKVQSFIANIFTKEKKELARLDYIFCSDEHLLNINRTFLQHDYYTDIITFDLSESATDIIAEIYISIDRVKDNAKTLGLSFADEALRVIFHGALHLCGYKDKKKAEVLIMRQKEDYYLKRFMRDI